MINFLVTDLINASAERIERAGSASPADVRDAGRRLVEFSDGLREKQRRLKDYLLVIYTAIPKWSGCGSRRRAFCGRSSRPI